MGYFDFIKKESTEDKIRKKLANSFDEVVSDAVNSPHSKGLIDNPMFGGLIVQGAISSVYQSLKEGDDSFELARLLDKEGLDYYAILEDECNKALDKYLQIPR